MSKFRSLFVFLFEILQIRYGPVKHTISDVLARFVDFAQFSQNYHATSSRLRNQSNGDVLLMSLAKTFSQYT